MTKIGKKLAAVFLAVAMVVTFMPVMGSVSGGKIGLQTAYAKTVLGSGTTGDCSWTYYTDDDDRDILEITGSGNGKMADYAYNSSTGGCTAPWDTYFDSTDEIHFINVKEIGDYSFYGFRKLSEIDIEGVQRIGKQAFRGCTNVSAVEIRGDVNKGCKIEESAFEDSMDWETNRESSNYIALYNVTTIGDDAFNECDSRWVTLDDGLESIGDGAFVGNRWVFGVEIPKSCTAIGDYAFYSCPDLEYAYILNDDCSLKSNSFDKNTKILARIGSATLQRAKALGFDVGAFGDYGELVLDLSSKDYSRSYAEDDEAGMIYHAFMIYSYDCGIHAHDNSFGNVKSEEDGALRLIDLNKDGEYDILVESDYEHYIISVKRIPESNLGGSFTFRLSEGVKNMEEAHAEPYYSTFTIKMGTAKVTVPKGKTLTYSGKEQTGVAAGKHYTVTGNTAAKAGTYEASLSLKDKINYTWSDGTTADKKVKWTIKKATNPLKISAKTATVKYSKLKKKTQTLAVTKVIKLTKQLKDKKTYTLVSAKKGSKSFKKYFKINKTTGKVTIKKNKKMKKGTYKVRVKVKALGNANYKASAWKTVTFKVKVK